MKLVHLTCCLAVAALLATSSHADWGPELLPVGGRVVEGQLVEADSFEVSAVCSDLSFKQGPCCLMDPQPDFCGDGGDDEVFAPGDIPAMSTYWSEDINCSQMDCSNYVAIWSIALDPGSLVFLFQNEPVSLGDVSGFDGLPATFCLFTGFVIPPEAAGTNLPWGFGVETPIDPFQVGTLGLLDITGGLACTPYVPAD